jgi:lipopolysaccharide export system permease protein
MLRKAPLNLIVPKTFIRDFRGVVAYVGERHGAEIKDIWIWRLDPEQRVTQFVRAETGRITLDENQNLLVLTLNHTSVEKRNENDPENVTAAPQTATFETTTQSFPLEKLFGHHSFTRKPEWYSPSELHEEIARLSVPKKDPHEEKLREIERMRYELIIQDKYTTAFAVLAFALVAVPLGIKVSRRETSANLGVAVALALAYYFLTVVVKWFNNQPGLRPDLLLWLPCLFFLGIGIWLNARIERAR